MESLTVLDFAGKNIRFERRNDRVWASLTDMAKATGKQVGHWTRLDGTVHFLKEFEDIAKIVPIKIIQGGIPQQQGTWVVKEVAIDFAAWCSTSFRVWVSQQIRSLIVEGATSLLQNSFAQTLHSIERELQGTIYLIGCKKTRTMKIGYTQNLEQRLQSLQQTFSFQLKILETISGTIETEAEMLERFDALRLKGEWFHWDLSILQAFSEYKLIKAA